jgi:hypothetical protein
MKMTKVIVSHKRANDVKTAKVFLDALICIPESQLGEYKEYNPDREFLVHPDSVVGLSPKRQWIYEKLGDNFQLDDDIISIRRVYMEKDSGKPISLTPFESSGLIDDIYNIIKPAGIKFFGFNSSANPKAYSGLTPIYHNKYITGGAFGIIKDENLFFPDYPHFVGEDYFISALNAHFNRFSYIDGRFAFQFCETERGKGGCSDYRTEEKRKETYFYLKKCFGNAIIPKKVSTIKKTVNNWEKTLKIPY